MSNRCQDAQQKHHKYLLSYEKSPKDLSQKPILILQKENCNYSQHRILFPLSETLWLSLIETEGLQAYADFQLGLFYFLLNLMG